MADLATLKARLAEAETALHQLNMGLGLVSVTYGDQRVDYNRGGVGALRLYISELQAEIARLEGRRGRRPLVVEF
ncbi:gpW family head-tail joining protein [Desulfarculus baarsii]